MDPLRAKFDDEIQPILLAELEAAGIEDTEPIVALERRAYVARRNFGVSHELALAVARWEYWFTSWVGVPILGPLGRLRFPLLELALCLVLILVTTPFYVLARGIQRVLGRGKPRS